MARIAFLLMAHRDPASVVAKARALTAHGDLVAIHYDRNAPEAEFAEVRAQLAGHPQIRFARRVRCGWGMWSLVQASLNMVAAVEAAPEDLTHFFLISGDCYPTKTRRYLDRLLRERPDTDFIECHDFFDSDWIKTGLKEERLIYRHHWNERRQPWLFYRSLWLQQRLGLRRRLPADLSIRIGSQWWLLRAETVHRVVRFLRARSDIQRFFKNSWIPDETAMQSLVAHLVPAREIAGHPQTHLAFSDYGVPLTYHRDHLDYLRAQDRVFARKISSRAPGLRAELLRIFEHGAEDPAAGGRSGALYRHLAGQGRVGARYAPRFWQAAIDPQPRAELLMVAARRDGLARKVEGAVARVRGLTALGAVFDSDAVLPLDLGNFERSLAKRTRHRRAFLNILFAALQGAPALLRVDPDRLDVIGDLARAAGEVRLLIVDEAPTETDAVEQAMTEGLIGPGSGAAEREAAAATHLRTWEDRRRQLIEAHRGTVFVVDRSRSRADNVLQIGHCLRCPRREAESILREIEGALR